MVEAAILCLALNVYHEARGEPLKAQQGVAQVTMTRAGGNPDNVCKVVYEPKQFSWANPLIGKRGAERQKVVNRLKPKETLTWNMSLQVATQAVDGTLPDVVGNARYFTNLATTNKNWTRGKRFVAKHGKTSFFR